MHFVPRNEILGLRRDRALRPHRRGTGGHQAADYRRGAAGAAGPAGAGARLAAIPGIRDLALTTNGVLLAEQAQRSTTPGCAGSTYTWTHSTRSASARSPAATTSAACTGRHRDGPPAGLRADQAQCRGGEGPGRPDIVPLARFAREHGFEVRYIEFMPLDAQQLWDRGKVLLADDILGRAVARDRAADCGAGPRPARPRRSSTASPTASARWVSSRR